MSQTHSSKFNAHATSLALHLLLLLSPCPPQSLTSSKLLLRLSSIWWSSFLIARSKPFLPHLLLRELAASFQSFYHWFNLRSSVIYDPIWGSPDRLPCSILRFCTIMTERYRLADEALLASLGYKQEFQCAFTPLEVFGTAFSIIDLLPSIASVLVYAIPNGSAASMVWGWLVANILMLSVGMSMAELASSTPMSGGVRLSLFLPVPIFNHSVLAYYWTHTLYPPQSHLLAWIVGCLFLYHRRSW